VSNKRCKIGVVRPFYMNTVWKYSGGKIMFKANKSAYNHNAFTDRKEIIEIFENTYSEIERKKDSSSSVISIYGLSGTGKSFLRKELKRILETNYSNSIVISHDFRLKSEKVTTLI